MRFSFFPVLIFVGLPPVFLGGCMGGGNFSDPVTDTLAKTPLMYKPDIQQGNVLSQNDINKLQPGMSGEQVRFIMGTPLVQDTFNQNRWDYVYTMKKGGGSVEKKRIALIFEDDRLVEIKGDYRPDSNAQPSDPETVVSIPDNKAKKGFVKDALSTFGFGDDLPQTKKKVETKPQETPGEVVTEPKPGVLDTDPSLEPRPQTTQDQGRME